jgi:hypothetical protein
VQIDASNTSIEVVVWPPSDSSCTA